MKIPQALLISIAFGWIVSPAAKAVVVIGAPTHDTDDALSFGSPFDAVVSIFDGDGSGSGTGILISSTQVLTAKHVLWKNNNASQIQVNFNDTNNNRISGGMIRGSAVYRAPNSANPSDIDGTDLVIITLASAVSGITPMRLLGDMSFAVGKEAIMVGFGQFGLGSDVETLSGWGQNKRRAGTNIIDHYGQAANPTGFQPNSANIFSTDFDDGTVGNNKLDQLGSSASPLGKESTTSNGDSGGPLLVEHEGEYLIAGVTSAGIDPDSQYGDVAWWTGVGPYQSTIESFGGVFVTVPEPSVMLLLPGFALLVFGRRRERKPL